MGVQVRLRLLGDRGERPRGPGSLLVPDLGAGASHIDGYLKESQQI